MRVDDVDLPWQLRLQVVEDTGVVYLTGVQVQPREMPIRRVHISGEAWKRIWLSVRRHAPPAHAFLVGFATKELWWARLARLRDEKPAGSRSWPEEHFRRVAQVYRLAERYNHRQGLVRGRNPGCVGNRRPLDQASAALPHRGLCRGDIMTGTRRRARGEGSITPYTTKAGERYQIVYRAHDPTAGKVRQFRVRGFAKRSDAQKVLRERLRDVERGQHVVRDDVTLGDWVSRWLEAERTQVRPSTWSSYARNLRVHVVPVLGAKRLQQVRPSDVSALYANLLQSGRADHAAGSGLSPRTVRYVHTILRKCLQAAVDVDALLMSNPAARAKPPKQAADAMRQDKLRYWTPGQASAFLSRTAHQRHHVAWLLLTTTGLRRGEALGLTWADVDLEVGRIYVQRSLVRVSGERPTWSDPKTSKGRRSVELDERSVAALRAHRARQAEEKLLVGVGYRGHGLVFAMPDGRPIHPERFSREFAETVRRSELPVIRLHDLRHTCPGAAGAHSPQDCPGAPRSREHFHHAGHLQPRAAVYAGGGGRAGRGSDLRRGTLRAFAVSTRGRSEHRRGTGGPARATRWACRSRPPPPGLRPGRPPDHPDLTCPRRRGRGHPLHGCRCQA